MRYYEKNDSSEDEEYVYQCKLQYYDNLWANIIIDVLNNNDKADFLLNLIYKKSSKILTNSGEKTTDFFISSNYDFWDVFLKTDDFLLDFSSKRDNANNTIWHYFADRIKYGLLIEKAINNNNILNLWNITNCCGDTVWKRLAINFNDVNFWNKMFERDDLLLDLWCKKNNENKTIWHDIAGNLKCNEFWDKISDRKYIIITLWGQIDNIWHTAVSNIMSKKFWKEVSNNRQILNLWYNKNNFNETVWHVSTDRKYRNSKIPDSFWVNIAKNYPDVLDEWDTKCDSNITIWHIISENLYSDIFWNEITKRNDFIKILNLTDNMNKNLLKNIVMGIGQNYGIKSIKFWNKISEINYDFSTWKNIVDHDKNTLWDYAVKNINSDKFWEHILTKKEIITFDFNNSGYFCSIWHKAVMYIQSNKFWTEIAKNTEILNSWKNKSYNGYTVWYYALIYLNCDDFWKEVINDDNILILFNEPDKYGKTVWTHINIKFKQFWQTIYNKKDILKLNTDDKEIIEKNYHSLSF